jgi:hypothetical protein
MYVHVCYVCVCMYACMHVRIITRNTSAHDSEIALGVLERLVSVRVVTAVSLSGSMLVCRPCLLHEGVGGSRDIASLFLNRDCRWR